MSEKIYSITSIEIDEDLAPLVQSMLDGSLRRGDFMEEYIAEAPEVVQIGEFEVPVAIREYIPEGEVWFTDSNGKTMKIKAKVSKERDWEKDFDAQKLKYFENCDDTQLLRELLAFIFGDGGHKTQELGHAKAVSKAIDHISGLKRKLQECNNDLHRQHAAVEMFKSTKFFANRSTSAKIKSL